MEADNHGFAKLAGWLALVLLASCGGGDAPSVESEIVGPQAVQDDIASCRSEAARGSASGRTTVRWAPLSAELPGLGERVLEVRAAEDLGASDALASSAGASEAPRLVRLGGVDALRGEAGDPVEVLLTPFQLADAEDELRAGADLLVWGGGRGGRPPAVSLASVRTNGLATFLGDCRQAWTPAFSAHAARVGSGASPAALLRRILVDPSGPEAQAFLASPEAGTLAGPVG